MLRPTSEFYDPMIAWFISDIRGYIALEQPLVDQNPVGPFLFRTRGYAQKGTGQNYVLHLEYNVGKSGTRRVRIKAYSDTEAIQLANQKLEKWRNGET